MLKKRLKSILAFVGRNIIPPFLVFILGVFLALNIIFSQNVSPLYLGIVEGRRPAIVQYLIKIKNIPALHSEVVKYANAYGRSLMDEVYEDETERQEAIGRLEKLLELNPKSRDVLYTLYKLQKEDGNDSAAQEYLQQARSIDPKINN